MNLNSISPIYFPSECNIDTSLFVPIAEASYQMDCMVGYFTSGSLVELASSLAIYLGSEEKEPLRLIISPNLTKEDIETIQEAVSIDGNLLPLLFPRFDINSSALINNTLKALCYLIAVRKLILRVALKYEGMFHTKCWLFKTNQGELAIHGSGNSTQSGLSKNFEQLSVDMEWESERAKIKVENLRDRFDKIWGGDYSGVTTVDVNQKTLNYIKKLQASVLDKEKIIQEITKEIENDRSSGISLAESNPQKIMLPHWLNYQSDEYSHQGQAVKAWIENSCTGILAIATGGGKTITSLIAACLAQEKEKAPLFILIAVPKIPLLNQWAKDVGIFGVEPVNTSGKSRSDVKKAIKNSFRKLRLGNSLTEIVIFTHDALKSELVPYIDTLRKNISCMLIADEVHNLGSKQFMSSPPKFFKYIIGLSATYERQFDEEGTKFLLQYFGNVVFEFSLKDAIGKCLVPYKYFAHKIYLTQEEEDEFSDLTYEIKKISYAAELSDGDSVKERWKQLCLKRRRVVEAASQKVTKLSELLSLARGKTERCLIFCTDKSPQQLLDTNQVLINEGLTFHQVTSEETSNKAKLAAILSDFNSGELQVLTSKRVLDEGFNVPQTEIAYLLSSNTVRRQWIQRLGRVLRISKDTNKKEAIIHDFIVFPIIGDRDIDSDLKSLVITEYQRISFFSELSSNGLEKDGSLQIAKQLIDLMSNTS